MTGAAVFVDKDGTLVDDVPYNADPALLRLRAGAAAGLAALARGGHAIVVVSNQSGIALGRFDTPQFERCMVALRGLLRAAAGVELTDLLHCPHAPARDGTPQCGCRKPAPGMLLEAARRHRLDLARSWMVGDTLDDIEAGHHAGCRAVHYDSGGETVWRRSPLRRAEHTCSDWAAVARHIRDAAALPQPA